MDDPSEMCRERVGSSMGRASEPIRTIPLLDAMVDVALVYGFDESCSRELGVMADEEVRRQVSIYQINTCSLILTNHVTVQYHANLFLPLCSLNNCRISIVLLTS